jgi:hypothetical protein
MKYYSHDHLFYDVHIYRDREKSYIQHLLEKYQGQPITEELKKNIWEELQKEKYEGNIKIPFRIVTRQDATGKYPSSLEVILDTKV